MRIIAGQYRSRPLRAAPGLDTRPTTDRTRETLFNVVTAGNPAALEGSVWLDIFAGTGAVGIEALSRGARRVYFIESARRAAAVIRENLRSLGIGEGFAVVEREAVPALRMLEAGEVTADYCFLDPPYRRQEAYRETLEFLSQSRLVGEPTLIVAEHDRHFDPGERVGTLVRRRKLVQGDAGLSFYRRG
jgi:16S rRNA (guanine(966)-N(2))-methyltransferase RsmD